MSDSPQIAADRSRATAARIELLERRTARGAGALLALMLLVACSSTPTDEAQRAGDADTSEQTQPARSGSQRSDSAQPADTAVRAAGVEEPVPPDLAEQFDKAMVLMTSGDEMAAEQALRALAAQHPGYSGPLLNLGILYARTDRLENAEQAIQAAIERNPQNAQAFNQLGIVYRRLGRFGDADVAYQRAIELAPNYANSYLNLGVLCDLYLQQPQRALEAFERYLQVASAPDEKVKTWISELKTRLGNERSAGMQ